MTRRLQLALVLALVAALLAILRMATLDSAAAAPVQAPIWLDVGDRVQLVGAPVGCRVAVIKGAKTLDCRIAGKLAGSYGTMMTTRRLLVVHFRSQRLAKVVFTAKQRGDFRVCR